jgi:hypothetical protein
MPPMQARIIGRMRAMQRWLSENQNWVPVSVMGMALLLLYKITKNPQTVGTVGMPYFDDGARFPTYRL